MERWIQSACVLCSNGCGLDIAGGMALLRDLHDLYLMVQECDIS